MTSNPTQHFLGRVRILSLCIALFALLLICRLFYVQIIHGQTYSERADRQYVTPTTDIFERGTIYLTQKDGTLVSGATLMSGFKLAINPQKITDVNSVYKSLSTITPIDEIRFTEQSNKKTDPYEEVALKLTKDQADAITKLALQGVTLYKQKWRFYPGGNLAAQTLGFVAYKGDSLVGRYGLERQYEDVLSRQNDSTSMNFFAEVFSDIGNNFFKNTHTEGDIVTTIEPTVQSQLQKELQSVVDQWHSDSVGGIIMDPHTGEILAMANLPDYDLNNFSKVDNPLLFANPLVENDYELGSVIKPLVIGAAIDQGVITPTTTYDDKGFVIVNKQKIKNFDGKGRGVIGMQQVLNESLNTGMVFVEQKMGNVSFRNYMLKYGIGEKTGIDLPNEVRGLVENLQSPRDVEYATASFGQGFAITPIEAIRAFSALANDGKTASPHLVKRIEYANGGGTDIVVPEGTQVISKEAADQVTQMLITVVDKALLNGSVKLDHYTMATKTGTAQISKENGQGYYDDRYLHSFFGYYPAYDPKFVVFLYTVYPKGAQYASHTLTYPFIDLAKFLLNYYNVAPDR